MSTQITSITPPNLELVKLRLTYNDAEQPRKKRQKYKITIELSVESDSSDESNELVASKT
jgi:hypothetical protein